MQHPGLSSHQLNYLNHEHRFPCQEPATCKAKRVLTLLTPKRWALFCCISTHKRDDSPAPSQDTEKIGNEEILLEQTLFHLSQSRGRDRGHNGNREPLYITQRTASQQLGWNEHPHLLSDPCGSDRAGRSSSPSLNHWRVRTRCHS